MIDHVDTPLGRFAAGLPPTWKWEAALDPPAGHQREWSAWLAQAQRDEGETLLRYWARRAPSRS